MRAGDEIIAGAAPAMITFNGGTQVYLNANSRAKLVTEGRDTVLRLMNGDMAYKISQSSPVSIAGLNDAAYASSAKTGRVSVLDNRAVYSSVDPARWAGVAPITLTPANIYSVVNQVRATDALSQLPNDPGNIVDTPITVPTTPLSPLSYR